MREQAKSEQIRKPKDFVREKVPEQIRTSETVAKLFNTNEKYFQYANNLKAEAPELLEKVRDGEISLKEATNIHKGSPHLNILATDSNEWYTPSKYVESARKVME